MTPVKRRMLITGGSGFIGSQLIDALTRTGEWEEIHAIHHSATVPTTPNKALIWHRADLLNKTTPADLLASIKPSHLIHGAWVTDHGAFWADQRNSEWLAASVRLADAFARHGGQRFINLGSVAEYDWQSGRMVEDETPETPSSFYGKSKLAFHRELLERGRKGDFSSATGRIFFVYGPKEKPQRLVAAACRSLITDQSEIFSVGSQWRDYMHVSDLARGIYALTTSPLEGAVNIASGAPIRVSFILDELEKLAHKPGQLSRKTKSPADEEVPMLFGHAERLASTGWRPLVSLEEGLRQTLNWWREQLLKG